jgi:hypothetical protein
MKRILIATLVLACLALSQGKLMASLVGLDQPATVSLTDGCADPNNSNE